MKRIILGGGWFWGVEKVFSMIPGVLNTEVGYANGRTKNPTYEEVCTNDTDFVEVCYVTYDENEILLEDLLEKFWSAIDPTSVDRQGMDVGRQYRSGIYYIDEEDFDILKKSKENVQKRYLMPIATEIEKLKNYYKAEEYHQGYLRKNPDGYCHIKWFFIYMIF